MFGKALTPYGSNLTAGPLGVVQLAFNGYDLGKTTDHTAVSPDVDMKDIAYQQNGTKGADHVLTGADWTLKCTFGEISTELLKILAPYLFGSSGSVGHDSGHIKAALFESLLDKYAGVLKAAAVLDQAPSEAIEDTLMFYKVLPLVSGDFIQWGVDVQRNFPMEFKIKGRLILPSESTALANKVVYGYLGDPSNEDLPAADWPDLEAPQLLSVSVEDETSLKFTFDEILSLISGVDPVDRIMVKKDDGTFAAPVSVDLDDPASSVTATFAAATFAAGDIVYAFMAEGTYEDSAENANESIDNYEATNSI